MQGSRDYLEKVKPEVVIPLSKFPGLNNLEFGNNGELDIRGVVTKETLGDDTHVTRTIQILNAKSPKQGGRV